MRAGGDRRAGRLWWAGPTALVVLGGTTFAFVLAPELSGTPRIPDSVVIQPAATQSATATPTARPTHHSTPPPSQTPTQQPTVQPTVQPTTGTGEPDGAVVEPTRPVVSESPDGHESEGGDDGTRRDRHGGTG